MRIDKCLISLSFLNYTSKQIFMILWFHSTLNILSRWWISIKSFHKSNIYHNKNFRLFKYHLSWGFKDRSGKKLCDDILSTSYQHYHQSCHLSFMNCDDDAELKRKFEFISPLNIHLSSSSPFHLLFLILSILSDISLNILSVFNIACWFCLCWVIATK